MNASPVLPLLIGTGSMLGLGLPLSMAANVHGAGPWVFAFWTSLGAGVVLSVLGVLRHGGARPSWRLVRFSALNGFLGQALPMSVAYGVVSETGPGFASLAFTLPPVFTLAISLAIGVERPSLRRTAAVVVGLASALLLATGRAWSLDMSLATAGAMLLIPASIGAANVYRSLHMPDDVPGEWLSASTLLASGSMLGVAAAVFGRLELPFTAGAASLIGVQILALVVGYLLYFALQRRAEPVTFSLIGYVISLTGVLAGNWLFDEALPATTWPALALVAASLWLVQGGAPKMVTARGAIGAARH